MLQNHCFFILLHEMTYSAYLVKMKSFLKQIFNEVSLDIMCILSSCLHFIFLSCLHHWTVLQLYSNLASSCGDKGNNSSYSLMSFHAMEYSHPAVSLCVNWICCSWSTSWDWADIWTGTNPSTGCVGLWHD